MTTEPTTYEDSGGPGLEMGGVDENLADLQPEDSDSEEEGQEGGPVLTPDQQACDMHVTCSVHVVLDSEEGQEGGPVLTPDQQACNMHVTCSMYM